MRVRLIALIALPLLSAGIACSSTSVLDSFPTGGVGGINEVTSSPPIVSSPCPNESTISGSQCTEPLVCEYGTSPSSACNVVAVCNDQNSFDTTPASSSACDDRCPLFDAPGALATSQGAPCVAGSLGNLICSSPYDRSTCGCVPPGYGGYGDGGIIPPPPNNDASTTSDAGSDASADPDAQSATDDAGDSGAAPTDVMGVWVCVTPIVGCPATRPALGSSCVHELTCDYGACAFPGGMTVTCATSTDGSAYWIDATPPQCSAQN